MIPPDPDGPVALISKAIPLCNAEGFSRWTLLNPKNPDLPVKDLPETWQIMATHEEYGPLVLNINVNLEMSPARMALAISHFFGDQARAREALLNGDYEQGEPI